MKGSKFSRRRFLTTTAAAATATVAMPYMRTAYSAGKLTMGLWDHWVPGANDTMSAIVKEWGEKNHVDVTIDYITSVGDKDLLTASAEAQAKTGHDIMQHRAWQIQVHRAVLEPMDDVINQLIKDHGPIAPVTEYLAKDKGKWFGVPTIVGSQVKPCCSRLDLYKQYCRPRSPEDVPGTGRHARPGAGRQLDLGPLPLLRHQAQQRRLPDRHCRSGRPAMPSTGSARCSGPTARCSSTRRTPSRSIRRRPAQRSRWA